MPTDNCRCGKCGKPFQQRYFYKTNSSILSNNGFMPICKDCVSERYELFVMEYHDSKKAMQRMCMALDIYYSDAVYAMCNDKDGVVSISQYIQKTNMVQHKGKTFETSLEEGFYFTGDGGIGLGLAEDDGEPQVNPKLIEKWGSGFNYEDYDVLEKHYNYLKASNPRGDNNQEIFIIDLCYTKMQQLKAVKEGRIDDYNKLTESYRKSFSQAGLKAVKETTDAEDFKFGVTAETIEKYTPAEYYKNKNLFKDHDNIGDYFTRFVLRPLRNLQHGSDERDFEYFVKDENDSDGDFDDE